MEEKVFKLIYDYLNDRYRNTDINDMFIVWSCYILGNRKYLVGLKNSSNYFEVTYNMNKKEWYIDEYNKVNNICIKD
nr:MAG TPA: hypothetical protein [Crassvirales sp.]